MTAQRRPILRGDTGTLLNGADWDAGRRAQGSFDGVDDYIALPNLDVPSSGLTLAAWVKNTAFPQNVDQRFLSKAVDSSEQGHYWMLGLTNAGENRLRFRLKTGGTTTTLIASSGALPLNKWYHAVATYDGSRMQLFLDGVLVGSVAKTGALSTNATVRAQIGRNPDGSNPMSGVINDVRIYNRALTTSEIAGIMQGDAPANQAPTVSLTAPAASATYTAPATIAIAASASDTDGTVSRVDFYQGATLLGSDTTSPYGWTWTNVAAGSYQVTAVARDNGGAARTSAAASVTVNSTANQPPSVALTSPVAGAAFTAPGNVTLAASASDSDGTVARVEFYRGTTLIASDTTSPYSALWSSAPAGVYSLTARAVDDDGATRTSTAVNITLTTVANQLPTVSITSPSAGQSFTAPASLTMTAAASDTDGTITASISTSGRSSSLRTRRVLTLRRGPTSRPPITP